MTTSLPRLAARNRHGRGSRAADHNPTNTRDPAVVRVGGLARNSSAKAVGDPAPRAVEVVVVVPATVPARARRREGPPLAAQPDLQLDELAGRRNVTATEAAVESRRFAVDHSLPRRVQRRSGAHKQSDIARRAADRRLPAVAEPDGAAGA